MQKLTATLPLPIVSQTLCLIQLPKDVGFPQEYQSPAQQKPPEQSTKDCSTQVSVEVALPSNFVSATGAFLQYIENNQLQL